jgi:hypothetical protein
LSWILPKSTEVSWSLSQTMIHIRDKNYNQALHEFQVQKIWSGKFRIDGNRHVWNC